MVTGDLLSVSIKKAFSNDHEKRENNHAIVLIKNGLPA